MLCRGPILGLMPRVCEGAPLGLFLCQYMGLCLAIFSWGTYLLVYIYGTIRRTDFLPVRAKGTEDPDEVLRRGDESDAGGDSMDEGIEHCFGSAMAGCIDSSESECSDEDECGNALELSDIDLETLAMRRCTPSAATVDFA